MKRYLSRVLVAALCAAANVAAIAADADGKPARTYALVAAFGNQMDFVQAKYQTGTHLDPYVRRSVALSGQSLNATILRAIDDTLAQQMPQARRVYLALQPSVTAGLSPERREAAALQAVLDTVRQMPQRKDWDEILVVTPAYVASEFNGLPPRTAGAGISVQAIEGTTIVSANRDNVWINADTSGNPPESVVAPGGFNHTSRVYLGIHFYMNIHRYDAKTLDLISHETRFDSVKLHDPAAADTYLLRSIPANVLAQRLTLVVQESTAAAVRRAMGMVIVGPLKEAGPDAEK